MQEKRYPSVGYGRATDIRILHCTDVFKINAEEGHRKRWIDSIRSDCEKLNVNVQSNKSRTASIYRMINKSRTTFRHII